MKLLRYVLAIVVMCALGGMVQAHAFQLGVLDSGPGVDYTGVALTGLTFSPCTLGSLDGCITIENETGSLLTSFQVAFSTTGTTGPLSAGSCGTLGTFSNCSEAEVGGNYIFTFSGGSGVPTDPNGMSEGEENAESGDTDDLNLSDTFTIQVTGEPYTDFGPMTLTSTPEPGSIWLMSTGALMLVGFFVYSRRRNGVGEAGL